MRADGTRYGRVETGRQMAGRCGRLLAGVLGAMGALLLPASAAATNSYRAPVNVEPPHIAGTPGVGQSLSCSQGSWQNASSYTYAWLRDGSLIPGQATSTYVVQNADQGHSISCQVNASGGGGDYTIIGMPSSSYYVIFASEYGLQTSYLPQYYNGQSEPTNATLVPVTAPNTTSGIDAALQLGSQITGRAIAASGAGPLANVEVCAYGPVARHCATTNAAGEYDILGLPAGSAYTVEFSPTAATGDYLSLFKRGISVAAVSTTVGVDAALPSGGRILGRVTSASSGAGLSGIEVCAYNRFENVGVGCVTTNLHGEYTIERLPPESYKVLFTLPYNSAGAGNYLAQFYNNQSSMSSATVIQVTEGSTATEINGALQAGGEITGRVTAASTNVPLANVQVCDEFEGNYSSYIRAGFCVTTNATGEYTLMGIPTGKYEVYLPPLFCGLEEPGCVPQNYLAESYNGSVSVTAGSTVTGVDVALPPGGQLSGRVTAASGGGPLPNISVCLAGACTTTDSNGEYTLIGLYSVTSEVNFFPTKVSDYLSTVHASVTVTAGEATSGIDAALQTGGQLTGTVTDSSTHQPLSGIEVCASATTTPFQECVTTTAGGSASSTSNPLTIPAAPPSTTPTVTVATEPAKANSAKRKAPTANQKLAKALKACRKLKTKSKRRRCEAQARKHYTLKRKTHRRHRRS